MKIIKVGNVELKVKLATTEEQQALGLMNISSLPKDHGMLFVYQKEKYLSFWMKNTSIPLAIAFIDKNKRITQIELLEPYNEAVVKSKQPSQWALEVNQDWFNNNNVGIGDTIDIFNREIKIRVLNKV